MDFSLNPCAKLPHYDCFGHLVFEDGGSGIAGSILVERGAGHSVAAAQFRTRVQPSASVKERLLRFGD